MFAQIRYRAKALIGAAGLILVGMAEYVVTDPGTQQLLGQTLPAPWNQAIPVLLIALSAGLIHAVPNAPKPGTAGSPITAAQADAIRRLIDDHLASRIRAQTAQRQAAAPRPVSTATGIVQLAPPVGGGN